MCCLPVKLKIGPLPPVTVDSGHTLSLTHNAVHDKDLEVRKESLDDKLGEHLFLEVNHTAATR